MHVHFDEAKFESDLRHVFAQMSADPEIHDAGAVILDRNREVSVQMGMMLCKEMNRGEDIADIASAAAGAFIEFFANVRTYIEPSQQEDFDKYVMADIMEGVMAVIADVGAFEQGAPATMQKIRGGRA